jgi:hypothetical protein
VINKQQIYSFTSNFPNLQGLRAIPVGFFLLIVVVWDNQQGGASRDLTLMIIVAAAMAVFYWFVDRYYKLAFGSVEQTPRKQMKNFVISGTTGVLGLASFILDSALDLPLSLMGLLWMMLLIFDGARIAQALPRKNFPFFWSFAFLIGIISILPLIGLQEWWLAFGFRDQSLAILTVISLITLLSGVLWHTFLIRNLAIGDQR